jgi:hypothetical protein
MIYENLYKPSSEDSSPFNITFKGKVLKVHDILTHEMGVEEGIIVKIQYPNVYVKEFNTNTQEIGEEGWIVSDDNDNKGYLKWRKNKI